MIKAKPEYRFFIHWVSERMDIFHLKNSGEPAPWTNDPILKNYKFTNVYRILDRVSQHLITKVIYPDRNRENSKKYSAEEMLKRVMVFKHFNKCETWDALISHFGDIDKNVSIQEIIEYCSWMKSKNVSLYSNAYMMCSLPLKGKVGYEDLWETKEKHRRHLSVLDREVLSGENIERIIAAKDLKTVCEILSGVTGMGKFLAFQYAQDLSYCPQFEFKIEDYCEIGPGTERGIERCFEVKSKDDYQKVILQVRDNLRKDVKDEGYSFKELEDYEYTVADICNCFCEVDKYLRGYGVQSVSHSGKEIAGNRIKQGYKKAKTNMEGYMVP
jgi:hypothetical protein